METAKILASALALVAAPTLALAVPISAGDSDSYGAAIAPGESYQWDFEPTETLNLFFAVSGSGEAADLFEVTYGFIDGTAYSFDFIEDDTQGPESALGSLPDMTTGDPFYVRALLSDNATDEVGVTLSVDAEAAPPPGQVPLPAAGLLLVGGLGTLAAAKRRKG